MLGEYLEWHENIYGTTYGLKYIYKYSENLASSIDYIGGSLPLAIIILKTAVLFQDSKYENIANFLSLHKYNCM